MTVQTVTASPELVELVVNIQDTGLLVLAGCFLVAAYSGKEIDGWPLDLWGVCLIGSGAVVVGTALLRIWG